MIHSNNFSYWDHGILFCSLVALILIQPKNQKKEVVLILYFTIYTHNFTKIRIQETTCVCIVILL